MVQLLWTPDVARRKDFYRRNILHLACEYGRSTTVEFLMVKHPDMAQDAWRKGNSPLHNACGNSLLDCRLVPRLIALYPNALTARNLSGQTHIAKALEVRGFAATLSPQWNDLIILGSSYERQVHRTERSVRTRWSRESTIATDSIVAGSGGSG